MRRIPIAVRSAAVLVIAVLAFGLPGCGPKLAGPEEREAIRKAMIAKGIKPPPKPLEDRSEMFPSRHTLGRRPTPRR